MNKILIIGAQGQLSRALAAQLGADAFIIGSAEMDLAKPGFSALLPDKPFRAVINAAAYTQVDKAEIKPERAMQINASAVGELASWCKTRHLPLLHYSTDYVFDGSGTDFRSEDEMVAPLNLYGQSKLLGERVLADSGADYLILRTSWVYDAAGANFANTMCRLFTQHESIRVVSDQVGAPTYAPHLAAASIVALSKALQADKFPSGIYHLCALGACSWYEFAQAILALASTHESGIKCKLIQPILTAEYPTPARRPLNSRLNCDKAITQLSVTLPDWREGLQAWAQARYETDKNPS